jgi:NAD(P)-dependent dehydrogenase (short-subunit alcohol dehydrogenase family)
LSFYIIDTSDESTISDAASYCRDRYSSGKNSHLRLAFLLPGMLVPERSPSQITSAAATATLHLNLLAPLLLMKHFSPLLPKKATSINGSLSPSDLRGLNREIAIMAFMSARVGSISDNRAGGWYSYRASKAGVNAMVKSLDIYLRAGSGGNSMAVGLHPGTVKTELSREFWGSTPREKLFEAGFAAEKLCGVVGGLGRGDGGRCWDWRGEEILP